MALALHLKSLRLGRWGGTLRRRPLTPLGGRILDAMASRGIANPAELARRLEVEGSTVHRWLYVGVRSIDAVTILRLSNTVNTSFSWLLTGEGSPTKRRMLTPDADLLLSLFEELSQPARQRLIDLAAELVAIPRLSTEARQEGESEDDR